MGENGKDLLLLLMQLAQTKSEIPKDWKIFVIVPIHRKGERVNAIEGVHF